MSKYDKINNYNIEEKSPLVEGENLILSAKPKKSAFIINQAFGMLPIAIIWLLIDGGIIAGIVSSGEIKEVGFFIIPFFALHLFPVWIWLANILSANRRWRNTRYYVTDKRIIIQNGFIAENHQTIYYKDIKNVYMRRGLIDKMLKVGDIYFDLGYYSNSRNNQNVLVGFLDIENSNDVYSKVQKIILDIQTDIEYPNALRPNENPGYKTKYKG